MTQGKIVILSGPSASGKTTLHNKLLENPRIRQKLFKSISATTRAKRPGEKHGKDYLFLSMPMFRHKIKAGHFLEWQKVFDNYYGTPLKKVRELLKTGKFVLLCIDVKGARVVWHKFPDAVKIFIQPPSIAELEKRLVSRASDSIKSVELRLKTAQQEMVQAKDYDFVIINDSLPTAYKRLERIILEQLNTSSTANKIR